MFETAAMARDESLNVSAFEILTKLSSGGMGDVLLARRRGAHGFEKLIAIKTIRGDLAKRPDIQAMFLDEARLVARLDHPAIAQVYDFGEEDGSLYLAMEYVPGIALNKLLMKRGRPLPPVVALKIAAEVCRGIHAAHELSDLQGNLLGVVHRDMSPGNLILTFDGHMKILDFGIAFMNERESPDTQVGELKGKPSYMAPEQLRAEQVDRRSDLYSLSVVLHEMLTGRKLFIKNNVVATALAVERGDVPLPSSINPLLDDDIDEVAMKGLQRDPDVRYQDARQMAKALDEVIASRSDAPSLENFVDDELAEERQGHKIWLNAVLSGTYRESGTYDAFDERMATSSEDRSITKNEGRPAPPTPAPKGSEAEHASPLADPTLIPAATSEVRAIRADRLSQVKRYGALPLLLLLAFGIGIGYQAVSRPKIEPIKPLPPITEKITKKVVEEPQPEVAIVEPEVPKPSEDVEAVEDPALPEGDAPPEKPAINKRRPKRPKVPKKRRPKVVKVKPETPEGFGYVTVGAKPYARVRIDGVEIGVTPIMRKKLPSGKHTIQLVRPDTGEVRLTKVVLLTPGQHKRITQN